MNDTSTILRRLFFASCILLSVARPSDAQKSLRKQDLCPDYTEIDPLLECREVDSFGTLASIINAAPSGSELVFCPFFLRKVSSLDPITVKRGVTVKCARTTTDQFCTIDGLGNHMIIDTAEDTLWQGFIFRGSNDHAVIVSGEADNAGTATHTFCQSSFMDNTRIKETRGGAMMLERSSGTINVVECFFQDNYSSTYGAGIYSRANQLNVIFSVFLKNKSKGYGPCVFTAQGGLMVKTTKFKANNGREGYDIVFNPGESSSIYEDGFGNVMFGECKGVYNVADDTCVEFQTRAPTSPPTSPPTFRRTDPPSLRPSKQTTKAPIVTARPTRPPIVALTASPVRSPTAAPINPTGVPTKAPVVVTAGPTFRPTKAPVVQTGTPTSTPTATPTAAPITPTAAPIPVTGAPTFRPTLRPTLATKPPTEKPTQLPTGKPTSRPTQEFGQMISNFCNFETIRDDRQCISVASFLDFKTAIEASTGDDVVFCGGFNLQKTMYKPATISRSVDIRCVDRCTFSGRGPFVEVDGISKVRLQNLQFENAQNTSAVTVNTLSPAAKTTLCDTEFRGNKVSQDKVNLGGALTVMTGSGVVNVVNSTFTGNVASRGGAIHADGYKLNIVGSKFVANNAYSTGNAIFVGNGNHLFIEESEFILNTAYQFRHGQRGSETKSVAIAAQPSKSIRSGESRYAKLDDGGSNQMILSGECGGYYVLHNGFCYNFRSQNP